MNLGLARGGEKGGAFQFLLVEEKDIELAANIKHHPLLKAIQKDFFSLTHPPIDKSKGIAQR